MGRSQALSYYDERRLLNSSLKKLGSQRKKGDKAGTSKGRKPEKSQYVLSILFVVFFLIKCLWERND